MSDSDGYPIIWISSSSDSEDSAGYATCAEDTIDLELSDNDEICHLIAALVVAEAEEQGANNPALDNGGVDRTLYQITSGGAVTTTPHWATGGTAQVGGAHVIALRKRKKKRQRHLQYYVAFVGRPSGIHRGWHDARAATEGISSNCFQGYATLEQARAALEYVDERGWVGGAEGQFPNPRTLPVPLDPHSLEAPPLTPLCPSDQYRKYYCVFRGQRPGIYASMIEAYLSAIGVPTAVHESFSSISVAREKYLRAVDTHEIVVIPMP